MDILYTACGKPELVFLEGSLAVDKHIVLENLLPETSPIKVLAHLCRDIVIGMFTAVFFCVCDSKKSGTA